MFKATSKCNAELESPKIFILIEEKMILLGYMSSRYKTLNAVKLSGQLKILDANLEFDDGVWQCQVTPSSFQLRDSLISEGAEVVVRGNY